MASDPQVTIVVDDGRGNQESAVLPGPGGVIRFAVGEPPRHGAVWKVWASRNNSSVYVAIRGLGGYQKVSLHEGSQGSDWRFQWTSEHMQANPQISNRVIDRWTRPPETDESGWTTGVAIWTRHQDVVPAPNGESLPSDLVWVPPPTGGYAIGVHVVIAQPKNLFVEMKGALPLAAFMLADGKVVILAISRRLVTDEVDSMIDGVLTRAFGSANIRRNLQAANSPRMFLWGDGPDGDRHVWDVSVESRNDGQAE